MIGDGVSHGIVATRLRCDGIFNDQLITRLLMSVGEMILKIV